MTPPEARGSPSSSLGARGRPPSERVDHLPRSSWMDHVEDLSERVDGARGSPPSDLVDHLPRMERVDHLPRSAWITSLGARGRPPSERVDGARGRPPSERVDSLPLSTWMERARATARRRNAKGRHDRATARRCNAKGRHDQRVCIFEPELCCRGFSWRVLKRGFKAFSGKNHKDVTPSLTRRMRGPGCQPLLVCDALRATR